MVEQLVSISRSTIACRLGHKTDASGDNVRGGPVSLDPSTSFAVTRKNTA